MGNGIRTTGSQLAVPKKMADKRPAHFRYYVSPRTNGRASKGPSEHCSANGLPARVREQARTGRRTRTMIQLARENSGLFNSTVPDAREASSMELCRTLF